MFRDIDDSLRVDFNSAGGTNLVAEECGYVVASNSSSTFLLQGGLLASSFTEYKALEAGGRITLKVKTARKVWLLFSVGAPGLRIDGVSVSLKMAKRKNAVRGAAKASQEAKRARLAEQNLAPVPPVGSSQASHVSVLEQEREASVPASPPRALRPQMANMGPLVTPNSA